MHIARHTMYNQSRRASGAYTIVELLVIISVIGILAGGVLWVGSAIFATNTSSRDSKRASDTYSIAVLFEHYYRSKPTASGPSYPTTTDIETSLSTLVPDKTLITPPGAASAGLVPATSTATQTPSPKQYIYQPLTATDSLCTARPCVRFALYYFSETNDSIKIRESRHQQ